MCLLCVSVATYHPAASHNLQTTLTEITWSAESADLQVVHAVHLDDAMLLLARLGAADGRLSVAVQAQLMLYLENHFVLSRNGSSLPLQAVGAQIQGDFLWLYQELPEQELPEQEPPETDFPVGLSVQMTFMHEHFPQQSHQVNLLVGERVHSLQLDKNLTQGTFQAPLGLY